MREVAVAGDFDNFFNIRCIATYSPFSETTSASAEWNNNSLVNPDSEIMLEKDCNVYNDRVTDFVATINTGNTAASEISWPIWCSLSSFAEPHKVYTDTNIQSGWLCSHQTHSWIFTSQLPNTIDGIAFSNCKW